MSQTDVCQGDECVDHPQGCVDWCDAYAFCQGVGKRLCGRIGGGANGWADYANANLSQWYNACSSHGQFTFPYGDTYSRAACNDYWALSPVHTTVGVSAISTCQSPVASYAGVFDMSGNLLEWEDSCDGAGETGLCHLRGGSYFRTDNPADTSLTCGSEGSLIRVNQWPELGFRCCSEPKNQSP